MTDQAIPMNAYAPSDKSYPKLRKGLVRAAIYLILILNLVLTGYPLVWMIIGAFKTNEEYYGDPWGFPKALQWDNFRRAWEYGVKDYMFNSFYITALSVLGLLLVASLISYYLARRPFRGSKFLLLFFLFGMMIPGQSTLIPLTLLMKELGLLNTFFALFFPYVAFGLPVAVYLMTGYFQQIPKELDEAATVDGSGIYRTFASIYLPLGRPIISTITILSAFSIWNEFILPLVFANKDYLKGLPIGLMTFRGGFTAEYAVISAALVLATLPVILLYLLLSKQIESGLTAGAVKG
ncbi:ABC transporter permease subunit [Cohnella sp. CFH 77786]|uniref:carbohydrate ABC transporter permease n=1 Tax=Cohnella sp. CFH 77786 TaxID=2662265 RepID=UPI001C60A054|nr:carbohydrate ABC transporter permease [Cohnella sp. CFH 77786]MBW5449412.1 ABC transporter permease subunit [Cohnella sp. CFH 77786]